MRALLAACAAAVVLAGCTTSAPMGPQQATLANIQALRTAATPPMALGDFRPAASLPRGADRAIGVRADTLKAPGGSFAAYLRQTLEAELKGAGVFDAASPVVISGVLTRSEVSTGTPSRGALAAQFVVTRAGARIYEKELTADAEWPSSFIGAIAIPEAMDRYTALYPALVSKLINDPDFVRAVKGG